MKHSERQCLFNGIKVCRRSPSISHLLFADDNLLFFKLDEDQARNVRDLLTDFQRGMGQLLSPMKCSLLVRNGADEMLVNQVKSILEVERADFEAKYLGLPTPDGRMKRDVFEPIEQWYVKWMTLWKECTLSQAAKEVQIKAVAQSLPTYVMSVFKLPLGLCEDLMKHIRAYWWGSGGGHQKVQWIPWMTMIKPKSHGGLGFKDLRLFNQALLAHQAMRLITYPHNLCTQVLKARYFPQGNPLDMAPA
jgi:hypothetical protein